LISSAGFSKAASERARARGIDVLSLKEASCVDWTLVVNKLHQVVIDVIEPQCKAFPIIRDADEAILNTVMSRQEELFSQDRKLSTTVGNVLDAVLAPPEVGRVFMDHMCAKDQSVGVFTVEYFFPTPVSLFDVAGNIRDCERLFILDSSGVIRPIDGLRIVIDAQRSRTPIELRHGVLKDSPIAYGSGKGQAGELLVAVVEREQGEATLAVAQQKGVTSKSLVNVDSRSRTPQVTTTSMRVGADAGAGFFTVSAPAEVAWTATTDAQWATIVSGASGIGTGKVEFRVSQNDSGDQRVATVKAAGLHWTILQAPRGG
jgi:hypothetical protein